MNRPVFLFAWLPTLVALQGVPHTGALRTVFLLIGIAHLLFLKRGNPFTQSPFQIRAETVVFWLLAIWLAVQSAFVAGEPMVALQTLASHWGKLILMTLMGIALVKWYPDRRWIALSLFGGAFVHVLSTWGAQIFSVSQGHGLVFGQSLLTEYPVASSFTTAAFVWLIADGMSRIWHDQKIFSWSPRITLLLALMTLSAEGLLKAKSGQVMTMLLIVLACLLLIKRTRMARRWLIGIFLAGIVLAGLLIGTGGNRWIGLEESLRAAWREPFPTEVLITDAVPIPANTNHSFYMRAIRGKVAVEGITQHPWGLGYFPDVFGRYVTARFGLPNPIDSSNSGLLDFALAAGIPGLCLLLLLVSLLIHRGWLAFLTGRPEGIVLALLVFHQVGRYAIDGTLGSSRFTGFALVAGMVWALATRQKNEQSAIAT